MIITVAGRQAQWVANEGCSQVDENKAAGKLGEVFGGQTVLEVMVSAQRVNNSGATDKATVEDHEASK